MKNLIVNLMMAVMLIAFLPLTVHAQKVPQSRAEVNLTFAPLVKKTASSVVNIYAKKIVTQQTGLFVDPFFKQFFGNQLGPSRKSIQNSLGSGVILSAEGVIVTNAHVIDNAEEIVVVLDNGREYQAELLLQDSRTDLAILKIKADNLSFAVLGDSDDVEIGDLVLAIGNPFSVGQTVTSGIVSALARATGGLSDYRSFIQTDAAINPGNSGGALIDVDGKLIGINTAIYSRTGESLGIGFAVPVNMVRIVADYAVRGEELVRPWTGLGGQEIDWNLAQALGMDYPGGVLVENIYPDSPGDKAGIKVQDVIVQIDDYRFDSAQDLRFRLALKKPGERVVLKGFRDGKAKTWRMALNIPPENPKRNRTEIKGKNIFQGAILENLSPKVNDEIGRSVFATGVIIRSVKDQALALRFGFRLGDILLEINNTQIKTVRDVVRITNAKPESYTVVIDRNGKRIQQSFR